MGTRTSNWLVILCSLAIVGAISLSTRETNDIQGPGPSIRAAIAATAPVADWVSVTPDAEASGTKFPNTSGHTASFSIVYVGAEFDPMETFDLWCIGTNGINCSVQSTISLSPNIPQNVNVTFSTGSSVGAASVQLVASGWTTSFVDSGSRTYVIDAHPTVNPAGVVDEVIQNADGHTALFTVRNNGAPNTYTMTCEWAPSPCTADPPSKAFSTNELDTIVVTFNSGAIAGHYLLKLTATAGSMTDWDSDWVDVMEAISITNLAKHSEVYAVPTAQRTDTFVVRLPAQADTSLFMSVSCSGSLSGCSVDGPDTLSVGDTPVKVPVTYTAGSNGTSGTVTLTARKVWHTWISSTATLNVTATSSTLLTVSTANPGLEVNRAECLTVAAGAGSISCDDFQFVYPFMGVSRMNRSRQLGLIHNSGLRGAHGVIGAEFVLPPGVAEPDSVRATLVVSGVTIRTQQYGAAQYAPAERTRIAFDWSDYTTSGGIRVLDYSITLEKKSSGSWGGAVVASGKQLSLDHRTRYGRGWWIAGLEQLSIRGDTLIWTGPDASGGVFLKTGSIWTRQTRSVPDTITYDAGSSTYTRRPLGGGQVKFNSTGFHTKTIDRNGDETRFNYSSVVSWTRLTSVELPTPAGTDTIYRIKYNALGGLDTVAVRMGSGANWSRYVIKSDTVGTQGLHIDSIRSPDGMLTHFPGAAHGQLNTIIGPRGDTTVINYGHFKVATVTVKTVDVADVVLDYRASTRIGRASSGWNAPKPTDSVSTRIDGPLTGSADTTRFFTTGWGAVRGVRDALFNTTWVDRQDPALPALPTRVRHPNGWEVTAAYTAGGLPDTVIDRSTGGITTYTWNTTWRQPVTVTSPEGIVTAYTYDANGNRQTQSTGPDTVEFKYNADFLIDSIVDPMGRVTQLEYDTRGNLKREVGPDGVGARYGRDYRGLPDTVKTPTGGPGDSILVLTRRDIMGRDTLVTTTNTQDKMRTIVRTTYELGLRKRVEPRGVDSTATGWDTITTGASEWVYDGLGRVILAKTPVSKDTMLYDLGGRMTETRGSNGDAITMTYDVLGRLRSRTTSAKYFSQDTISQQAFVYPVFEPSGLTIPAAIDSFTYDVMGNMLTARNPHSRIMRTYELNGALASEIDSLKNYNSNAFDTHGYQRSYLYDLDGRRLHLFHPTWINNGSDRTDYTYAPTTGRLSSIKDALGNTYGFAYNADGQESAMTHPHGVDSTWYDSGGRLAASYDNAGRIISGGITYNGLGHVTFHPGLVEESFERDAFGNALMRRAYGDLQNVGDPGTAFASVHQQNAGGRLTTTFEEWEVTGGGGPLPPPQYWVPNWTQMSYDVRGNTIGTLNESYTWEFLGGQYGYDSAMVKTADRHFSVSFHRADGKIAVHQVNRDSLQFFPQPNDTLFGDPWGAYEEYWYDALGRRVLKRTRQSSPICTYTNRCYSAIERFVWDGDQILWEFRQADGADVKDPNPSPDNGQTGHVGYIHAGRLDLPIAMIRNDTTIMLWRNKLRGLFVGATTTTGATWGLSLSWPGNFAGRHLSGWEDAHATETWMGSLPRDQKDATGLSYRRNRYYDTQTAQFTQVDPIGIAGGYNLYGYANGDPINFSDPFGLKCEEGGAEKGQDDSGMEKGGDAKSPKCDLDGDGTVQGSERHAFAANDAASAGAEAWHTFWGVVATALEVRGVQDGLILIAAYRGGGRLSANPRASGPHTTFRRGPDGRISDYQTFHPNSLSPTGFQPGARFRATGRPHYDKASGQDIYPPMMRFPGGGARPATPGELPLGW